MTCDKKATKLKLDNGRFLVIPYGDASKDINYILNKWFNVTLFLKNETY